jgi:hypothetical protein
MQSDGSLVCPLTIRDILVDNCKSSLQQLEYAIPYLQSRYIPNLVESGKKFLQYHRHPLVVFHKEVLMSK